MDGIFDTWFPALDTWSSGVVLTVYICHCGVEFGIRPEFAKMKIGKTIFCPNGHKCKINS